MSQPRRSLGPVIAYMLTLLGLVLGGIWLWNAIRSGSRPRQMPAAQVAPPQIVAPPEVASPPNGEDLSATERRQLEEVLRAGQGRSEKGKRPNAKVKIQK